MNPSSTLAPQPPRFYQIVLRSLGRVILALLLAAAALGICALYAFYVEPYWVAVRTVRLSPQPTARVIHITDIHFKGDRAYLERVVRTINGLDADAVCFTGDLIEEARFAPGALEILSKLNKPLFGVAGNHDQWVIRSFDDFHRAFQATGGDWLEATPVLLSPKHLALVPLPAANVRTPAGYKRVILDHYPDAVQAVRGMPFDVMLAGHTHGGQVQIPLMHRVFHDVDLGRYIRGLYRTPSGPLYVNPGIGTFYLNVRFMCRPEITALEL